MLKTQTAKKEKGKHRQPENPLLFYRKMSWIKFCKEGLWQRRTRHEHYLKKEDVHANGLSLR